MHTKTSNFRPPVNTSPLHSPEWVYDEIMRHIEPDLMLQEIPLLNLKYAGENKAHYEARLQWYDDVFAMYDEIYPEVEKMLANEAHAIKNKARKQVRGKEEAEHSKEMKEAESAFDFDQ